MTMRRGCWVSRSGRQTPPSEEKCPGPTRALHRSRYRWTGAGAATGLGGATGFGAATGFATATGFGTFAMCGFGAAAAGFIGAATCATGG